MKTCKHLIFVTFLLFIVCQVHSQSNNNSTGCISGDCENGQGTYIFDDGIKYEGDFKNGHLTGKGTIYWPNGNTYTGELLNGKRHGLGYSKLKSGASYRGFFYNGKQHGYGSAYDENRKSFGGKWKNGEHIEGGFNLSFLSDGYVIIAHKYSEISYGNYGMINPEGKLIIPMKYRLISNFRDGLAKIWLAYSPGSAHWKEGFANQEGEMVIPIQKAIFGEFVDGRVSYSQGWPNKKYGFMDTTGRIVIPTIYNQVKDFKDGKALVQKRKNGKWYSIDKNGNKVE